MATKRVLKPKREPDAVVIFEDEFRNSKFEYLLWFDEMVVKHNSYIRTISAISKNKNAYYKKPEFSDIRKIERWISSSLKTKWTTIDEHGTDMRLNDDLDFGLEDYQLEEKIEQEYKNWSADKAIEEVLK